MSLLAFFVFLSAQSIASPYHAMTIVPDAGISDEYLVSLGTGAEAFLLKRLANSANEQYFDGIIARLEAIAMRRQPSPVISTGMINFIEKTTGHAPLSSRTFYVLRYAHRAVAFSNTDEGLSFLLGATKEKRHARNLRVSGLTKEEIDRHLFRFAVYALGHSNRPEARLRLLELATRRPQDLQRPEIDQEIRRALQELR